jgi:hypothetical protein
MGKRDDYEKKFIWTVDISFSTILFAEARKEFDNFKQFVYDISSNFSLSTH